MYLTVPACGRKILITGVSCVGKSSIGRRLAEILNCAFCDLDVELERHFRMPISRIKALSLTGYSFRKKASRVLGRILQENRGGYLIVALPPSGLCDWYRKVIKKHGAIVIALSDTAENILRRIVFYDDDSNRIEKELDERGRALYLREIRKDIGYFRRFHGKANLHVDLSGAAWPSVRKRSRQHSRTILGNDGQARGTSISR
jgi:Shikimate kinase